MTEPAKVRCTCPVGNDAIGPHLRRCPNHPEAVVLPDGCVGGHSPDLVSCSLGVDWP